MKTQIHHLLLLLLSACGSSSSPLEGCAPSNGHFLYVFGDSITLGLDGYSYADMYGCDQGFRVVNMSVGGTTIDAGNQYGMIMAHQSTWQKGDIVIFAPGENDAIVYKHDAAHVATFASDMAGIIAIIATKQVQAFIGTPTYSCNETSFGPNSDRDVYAQITRNAITAQGAANIHLIDFNANFQPTPAATYDCLHPNGTGNSIMAAMIPTQIGAQ